MSGPYTPRMAVEFAFDSTPNDDLTIASWTEVTHAKLVIDEVNIERGRTSEFDEFPAATCTIKARDGARIFDPSNTAGTYYEKLLVRTPVRVVGYIGATAYIRFVGYVDGWPVQNGRGYTTVQITATDASKVLAGKRLPQSVYETTVIADGPVAYWRLGEATGEVAVDVSGNKYDGTYTDNAKRAQSTLVPYSGDAAMGVSSLTYQGMQGPDGARLTLPCSIEMWVEASEPDTTSQLYLFWQTGGESGNTGIYLLIGRDSATDIFVIAYVLHAVFTDYITSWQCNPYDGQPHHLVFTLTSTLDGSTGYYVSNLYMDGVDQPRRAAGTGVSSAAGVGGPMVGSNTYRPAINGTIDDVSLWSGSMSTADIAAHYTDATAPWDGDTTGERINRILDLVGWPAAMRAIDTGTMILGPALLAGRSAMDYLKSVAASEQGRLFVDHQGLVTFHERSRFMTEATETTSQLTFSDDGAGDSIYAGLSFTYDDTKVVNAAAVSREGGSTQTAIDTTSQNALGPIEKSLSGLLLQHDRNSRQIAEYLVFRYKDPQVRAEGWRVEPELDAASWADVFGLEIGHRVTLECKPANAGSQIVVDQHLERIHEDINPERWVIEFNGSPVDPGGYLYWGSGLWGTGVWA